VTLSRNCLRLALCCRVRRYVSINLCRNPIVGFPHLYSQADFRRFLSADTRVRSCHDSTSFGTFNKPNPNVLFPVAWRRPWRQLSGPFQGPLPREAGCSLGLLGRGSRAGRSHLLPILASPLQRASDDWRHRMCAPPQSPAKAGWKKKRVDVGARLPPGPEAPVYTPPTRRKARRGGLTAHTPRMRFREGKRQ
jgi:hypothetical protein